MKRAKLIIATQACLFSISAFAAELSEMAGRWTWNKFTIEVSACENGRMCAKVIAGPKNVGMELFASALTTKDGDWFGEITDPATKITYNTRLRKSAADVWRLDGCTPTRICLSGEFVKAK